MTKKIEDENLLPIHPFTLALYPENTIE